MLVYIFLLVLASFTSASLPGLKLRQASFSGIATFNNYGAQGSTVCGSTAGQPGTYGAAAGDLSPDISGGLCPGNTDMGNCNGQVPVAGYVAPSCPTGNCGLCYSVTNQGGVDGGSIGGVGQSVIVQIIDSCPSQNAYNYCKTDVPAEQRCESSSLNAMDIDQAAYQALTGQPFGSGPNLNIQISPVSCSGYGSPYPNSPTNMTR